MIRDDRIAQFLACNGYAAADAEPLAQDASFRRYLRLTGERRAVLMDAPPPEDVRAFLRIAAHLWGIGLSVPHIIAADPVNGLVLEEDLGDDLLSLLLDQGRIPPEPLLDAAVDALVAMQRADPPGPPDGRVPAHPPDGSSRNLPDGLPQWDALPLWDAATMAQTAMGTLFDWWWPARFGAGAPDACRHDMARALDTMLAPVAAGPRCLVHRDFFAGNLLWLPDRTGPARIGIIDFQGAALGHPAYDLVSLVQDARRDLSPALQARAIQRYLAARPELEAADFRTAFAACAAQRHLRVACQWVRLAQRDSRPQYLAYGPRTWRLLEEALRQPAAAALAAALDQWLPAAARGNPPDMTAKPAHQRDKPSGSAPRT